MKVVIVNKAAFSILPFRNNVMNKTYLLNKCVSHIFASCLNKVHFSSTPKINDLRITLTLNILKSPDIIFKNYKPYSKFTHSPNFNVQSLWEIDGDEEGDRENNLKTNKPETSTLGREAFNQEDHLFRFIEKNCNRTKPLTNEEWQEIKRTTLEMTGNINYENVDAYIMNMCSDLKCLLLAKSYYKFLKSTNSVINRPTFGSYLRLFYLCKRSCTEDDLQEIYTVYKELLKVYPIIDCYTAEKAVAALSITKYWKEYERLFSIIKKSYVPSAYVYSIVVSAAFKNREFDLGWKLVHEMKHIGLPLPDDIFFSWLDSQKAGYKEMGVTALLDFFTKYNVKPSLNLCEYLKSALEEQPNMIGAWTSVTRRGNCKNCHINLEKAWVEEDEFHQLKKAFLDPVLIGKDIFLKTQPQEFDEFIKLLGKIAPYDVVLDGLNVALFAHKSRRSPTVYSFQLKSVVRKFVSEDRKVLVIGKKHMLKWPDMQEVFDNAHVFLAEDVSQDDPFVLYATLYSGLGTMFVSRDMMRGHKFLLADPLLQATFLKWQSQHQFFIKYIDANGHVQLSDPIPYMQTIQRNARGDWHIPYVMREELTDKDVVDNYHRHWLCVSGHRGRLAANTAHKPGVRPQSRTQDRPKMDREFVPRNIQPGNTNRRR